MLLTALALVGMIHAEPAIHLEPKFRTYEDLASDLTKAGLRVSAGREFSRRACVVALHDLTKNQAIAALEDGLSVKFQESETGYTLVASDEVVQAEKIKLAAFSRLADQQIAATVREAKNYSRGQLPMTKERIAELILRETKFGGSSPDLARVVAESTLPAEKKRALAMLYSTAAQDIPEFQGSGPTVHYFFNNGRIRRLFGGDVIDTGDPYFWRDWTGLPLWVRERALVTARNVEKRLSTERIPPEEFQQRLAREVAKIAITHRLSWDPATGTTSFEYSINQFNGDGIWYGEATMPYLSIPLEPSLLASIDPEFSTRLEQNNRLLGSSWLSKTTKFDDDSSMSAALVRACTRSNRNLVMEVSPVRDHLVPGEAPLGERIAWCSQPAKKRQEPPDLIPMLLGNSVRQFEGSTITLTGSSGQPANLVINNVANYSSQPLPLAATWTATEKDGVLILRNEWQFLDRQYPVDFRNAGHISAAASVDWQTLVAYVGAATSVQNAQFARAGLGPRSARYYAVYPYLRAMRRLRPAMRDDVCRKLMETSVAEFSVQSLPFEARRDLFRDLTALWSTTARSTESTHVRRHAPIHREFESYFESGEIRVTLVRSKPAKLSFSLNLTVGKLPAVAYGGAMSASVALSAVPTDLTWN